MRKWIGVLITLALVVCFAMPSLAAKRHFKLYVYKATASNQLNDPAKATRLTADVGYAVFAYESTGKSTTRETLYTAADKNTSLSQDPWVAETTFEANDVIDFWCDPTESGDAKVRILIVDKANGFSTWVDAEYDVTHTVIIDEVPGLLHTLTVPFWSDKDTALQTAVDTGVDLRYGTLIIDAYIDVHVVSATGSIDVGNADSGTAYISGSITTGLNFVQDDVFDTAMKFLTEDAGVDDRGLYYTQQGSAASASADGLINVLFIEQ